ncbi:CBO0543 family protein [Cohnella sp. GCM10012308]|uniref:CBO0543 family protein n=1 Tax=Cohnella sp. GCM10012308 TaxID=3317329 RepID=UPI00361450FA
MLIDRLWMGGSVLLLAALMIRLVSRDRLREMWAVLLTMQGLKWLLGALKAQFHLAAFPKRLFPFATQQDFATDFAVCPSLAVVYAVIVNGRSPRDRLLITVAFAIAFAVWSLAMTRWTNLQVHHRWSFGIDFLCVLILLPLSTRIGSWIVSETREREGAVRLHGSQSAH